LYIIGNHVERITEKDRERKREEGKMKEGRNKVVEI